MKTLIIEISEDCAALLQALADRCNATPVQVAQATQESIAAALVEVNIGRYQRQSTKPGTDALRRVPDINPPETFAQRIAQKDMQTIRSQNPQALDPRP